MNALHGFECFDANQWLSLVQSQVGALPDQPLLDEREGGHDWQGISQVLGGGPTAAQLRRFYWPLVKHLARDLGALDTQQCYVIGLSGSVSVGKSTFARAIALLLRSLVGSVEVLATDNFLLPNEELVHRQIMHRKGFPDSYDYDAINAFVESLQRGDQVLECPIYDHVAYTRLTDTLQRISRPQVLIVEGVSALQGECWPMSKRLFLAADPESLWQWYKRRFFEFRAQATDQPELFFHRYSQMTEEQALEVAINFWEKVNQVNFKHYIEPSMASADLVFYKADDHSVGRVYQPLPLNDS